MANTTHSRYLRTEEAIRSAFMSLLKERPVKSITVSAICRKAGISRNAFYLHHAGSTALYDSMMSELVDSARVSSQVTNRLFALGEENFEAICEHSLRSLEPHLKTLRTFLSVDDGTLEKRLLESTEAGLYHASAEIHGSAPDANRKLMLSHLAAGLMGFLKAWLVKTDLAIEDVLEPFTRMNTAAMRALTQYTADTMRTIGKPNKAD